MARFRPEFLAALSLLVPTAAWAQATGHGGVVAGEVPPMVSPQPDVLELVVAAKTQYGVSSAEGAGAAMEADFDVGFRWRPTRNWTVQANVEAREPLTDTHFSELVAASESLVGIADGTTGGPLIRLEKFWVRRDFDRGSITVGRLHFEDYFLNNALSSKSASAFTNEAFSGKTSAPFPRDAMGAALHLDLDDRWRVDLTLGEADREDEFDVFASGQLFATAQVEMSWAPPGLADGHYRIGVWSRSRDGGPRFSEAGGVGISVDQPLNDRVVLMARAHVGDAGFQRVERGAAVGMSVIPEARPGDQFGVGIAWLDPADPAQGPQTIIETFYRMKVTDHIALTPTLQWTGNGAGPSREDDSLFAGVRLRFAN